jgi:hypothetical protein
LEPNHVHPEPPTEEASATALPFGETYITEPAAPEPEEVPLPIPSDAAAAVAAPTPLSIPPVPQGRISRTLRKIYDGVILGKTTSTVDMADRDARDVADGVVRVRDGEEGVLSEGNWVVLV